MTVSKLLRVLPLLLAVSACSVFRDQPDAPDPDATAKQLYQEARSSLRSGNYFTAIEQLDGLLSRYPFGEYAQQAQLDIIYANYQADEWDAAIAAADRFIRLNPTHPRVDYALYMRGSANMERGRDFVGRLFGTDPSLRDPRSLRRAFADFKQLVTDFPGSEYVEDARPRMAVLRNQLAHYELAVARFYQQRSAYVAAAGRAKTIVETFQETPAVEDALEILAEAYQHLDLPKLRQDILRIIRLNNPDHPLDRQPDRT